MALAFIPSPALAPRIGPPLAPTARRVLLGTLAAVAHLAAAGALMLVGPGSRDTATDSPAMLVDLVMPAPSLVPEPPRPRVVPQPVVKREPVPVLAVARPQPAAESRETVPAREPPRPTSSPPTAAAATAAPATDPVPALVPARFDADYLNNPKPPYPAFSRRLGEQGRVLLSVSVNAHGQPDNVEVKTTSGSPRLDQAALEAVKRWRFVPAKRGDIPIQSWVTVPIVFSLEG